MKDEREREIWGERARERGEGGREGRRERGMGEDRNRRTADGQKDVNPTHSSRQHRALWVIANRTDVSVGTLHVTERGGEDERNR